MQLIKLQQRLILLSLKSIIGGELNLSEMDLIFCKYQKKV